MRISILALIIFRFSANAQNIYVKPQVIDLGVIHENNGVINVEFELLSQAKQLYRVVEYRVACGCTTVEFTKDSLKPNHSIGFRVGYDPKNRPGKFYKQITLVLKPLFGDSLLIDAYIKGTVISSSAVNYTPISFENAKLTIAPYNECDNENSIENFTNDLTYILDKDGYVNVGVFANVSLTDTADKLKIIKLKREIRKGLEKRKYNAWQIGFKDSVVNFQKPCVRFEAMGYESKSAKGTELILTEAVNKIFRNDYYEDTSVVSASYLCEGIPDKFSFTENSGNAFIQKTVRSVLIKKRAKIQLYFINQKLKELDILGENKKLIKKIIKAFDEEGIPEENVSFNPPIVMYKSGAKPAIQVSLIQEQMFKNENFAELKYFTDSLLALYKKQKQINERWLNNIPVYYKRIEFDDEFDTTDLKFIQWMELVKNKIETGYPVKIVIEATASNSPTTKNYDNNFVARRRYNSAKQMILKYCANKRVQNFESIIDQRELALIKGPLYSEHDFLIEQYRKYQYIKLIAVEYDSFSSIKSTRVPFMINFKNSNSELLINGNIFNRFIDGISDELKREGVAEIILESSISKLPLKIDHSNRVIAYERLQEMKEAIMKKIAEHGLNPLRLVFTEERVLVQGPNYNEKLSRELFQEYQYVKAIPKKLTTVDK